MDECYNNSNYEGAGALFQQNYDYLLGTMLVFTGISGAIGNMFSVVLLIRHRKLIKVKITWVLFVNMALVDSTQIVPTLICGVMLFQSRTPNLTDVLQLWGIRLGGFIMNVFPFVAQLITLVFTVIKVCVYLFPFQSRYMLTLKRTVICCAFCFILNLGLESLLFSSYYDFKYNPCRGIILVLVDQKSANSFYYVWFKLLLSLLPFLLTIFGNILLGVAVFRANKSKQMLTQYNKTQKHSEMNGGEKRTLMTAFLLVVTNVVGYSLQNSVLFYYLIRYPNSVSNVTKFPGYERIVSDLLLPACNAAVNSLVYIFVYLPTIRRAIEQDRAIKIQKSESFRSNTRPLYTRSSTGTSTVFARLNSRDSTCDTISYNSRSGASCESQSLGESPESSETEHLCLRRRSTKSGTPFYRSSLSTHEEDVSFAHDTPLPSLAESKEHSKSSDCDRIELGSLSTLSTYRPNPVARGNHDSRV